MTSLYFSKQRLIFAAFCLFTASLFFHIVKPYGILKVYANATRSNTKWEFSFDEWKNIAASPWLLENRTQSLLFASICNNLDQLLSIMSNKTNNIVLLRFNYPWQIMLQNQIYTLVKFGEVYNYIVMVGDEKSLKVCIELNLPCFNGTIYFETYYKGIDPTKDALISDEKHYKPLVWFKLRFYLDVLLKNYTIITTDTDIAFSRKNVWLSLEKYSEDVGHCDMLFMTENPVNTGFFYSKSNVDTIALFRVWANMEYSHPNLNDQGSFGVLKGIQYKLCETKNQCTEIKQTKTNQNTTEVAHLVSIRRFPSSYKRYSKNICPTGERMDPCLNTSFFVHPICIVGQMVKTEVLKKNGFWMIREPCSRTTLEYQSRTNRTDTMDIYRCRPKIFDDSNSENAFKKCQNTIAWTN